MALDTVQLDALEDGDDVATDLIAAKHYQIAKLAYGADGTANVVTSTTTNPLPVALSDTDNTVLDNMATDLAAIEITQDTIAGSVVARATGGHSYYTNLDTSALDTIKASAGTLYWLHITHTDATVVYVTFYDATSPTLGTSPVLCFPVPTQGDANGGGLTINFGPHGIEFTNSIKVGAATTFNGSTDPGTNVVFVNAGFE